MKTTLTERLLAAALLGSVLGVTGCASTAAESEPTTPSAEKASCKGQNGCKGTGTPGEAAGGVTGEKASCKGESSCNGQNGCKGSGTPGAEAGGTN